MRTSNGFNNNEYVKEDVKKDVEKRMQKDIIVCTSNNFNKDSTRVKIIFCIEIL